MGWLLERLPAALLEEPVWVGIVETMERYFETDFERIERIERARSTFTADREDLLAKLDELGETFDAEWNDEENLALTIAWRKDEIKFKNTAEPIENVIQRNFIGLRAFWDQFYCKKTDEYSPENLRTMDEIQSFDVDPDDYWLTSRGYLKVDVMSMLQHGITQEEVVSVIAGKVASVIPTHIVYDGVRFILIVECNDVGVRARVTFKELAVAIRTHGVLGAHVDYIAQPVAVPIQKNTTYRTNEYYEFDQMPMDFWPLDLPRKRFVGTIAVRLEGQLGSGSQEHSGYRQLGSGMGIPATEIQLGSAIYAGFVGQAGSGLAPLMSGS